jgi:molybdopterin converting factor small subunit
MTVRIHLDLALQKVTDGKKAVEVSGRTVGECIGVLIETYPDLESFLFDPGGIFKSYIGVYVNLQSTYPREMDTPVKDGDEIHLFMIFAGG